ncbi:MAG TPA: GNAT family N-acetyltransferase [Verrucomicrobiae bacterium]|nr:GNAT family N-acetyltransferase [Verrucomicrobiae bacterium]
MTDAAGLTTARLVLRRFTADDYDWLHALWSDPEVKRHMGGPASPEQTTALLHERILPGYAREPGFGMWVTLEREGDTPMGFHLPNHIQGETLVQVGYVLGKAHWGRGYATEMCEALLRYGFTELKLPRIHAITDVPNVGSQRVLLKAGLERHGERVFPHPSYRGATMAFFQRDAGDWLSSRA